MDYPRIIVDTKKVLQNVKTIVNMANEKGIGIAGVTKGFCAIEEIVNAYVEGGVKYLVDSRIQNLKKLEKFNVPKILSRLPMISEAEDVVKYADISLVSEVDTIKALSEVATKLNKTHRIIIMIDLGDLREGYFIEEEVYQAVEETIRLKGIEIAGIGTNLTCYGGLIPDEELLHRLVVIGDRINDKFGIELEIISGGNSSSLHLLKNGNLEGINNLRLGDSLMRGTESAYDQLIPNTYNDAFTLEVEIVEIKDKPSVAQGKIGRDAFGNIPTFIDRGVRKRIICAIGKQDIDFDTIFPIDKDLIILGGSSDHLIIDGSDSKIEYRIGDIIKFNMEYVSILRATTSSYVKKVII
ncbi:MAG: alanine/ornithine racemase family PLP-dependent enzyme [Tissierellia bacterium]|nr:alanine/ornithine racemase family PLP-dependent enzyme [Tissierellia bacterium]